MIFWNYMVENWNSFKYISYRCSLNYWTEKNMQFTKFKFKCTSCNYPLANIYLKPLLFFALCCYVLYHSIKLTVTCYEKALIKCKISSSYFFGFIGEVTAFQKLKLHWGIFLIIIGRKLLTLHNNKGQIKGF